MREIERGGIDWGSEPPIKQPVGKFYAISSEMTYSQNLNKFSPVSSFDSRLGVGGE